MELLGLHHVSLLTGKAEENYRFYTKLLGMRLVKKSVNQDNTQSYHLFYGDAKGSPGTEVTFFDIPMLGRTHQGVSSISSTSLRVKDTAALHFWKKRLEEKRIKHGEIIKRAGRDTLALEDTEGTKIILVADNGETGVAAGEPWETEEIPAQFAIVGLGPVTLTVAELKPTAEVITSLMGFTHIGSYPSLVSENLPDIEVYATGEGGAGAEVHIETRPELPKERLGRGGVHHVAFRVPNEGEYDAWAERIRQARVPNSGKVDRHYFKALYFREPNGILFELSTDMPGFDVDEPLEALGENLSLPPFLEPEREEIESKLRPLELT
ncbi:putative ring-cleaving dioxygenase MhqA [Thalassobacillus devorans]|uniref:Ring-cleaving dioxygenase MhqA n=1 Tax=Thalassobacillus devorans TaxID=279813 RepID=A0ABQ1PH06_9BACI|nr:ring-cleaving dioxygenase [Thalassobacillus devorans]NIK29480.1 glyoxalase family protein [Thalassobacillus devorans]GGC96993.1 putative ring-cleaving dioxygenase MhqA [Thalassobacillus devorans]